MNDESWKGEHLIRAPRGLPAEVDEALVGKSPKVKIDERQFLILATRGHTQAEISRRMGCSPTAVRNASIRLNMPLTVGKRGLKV